MAGNSLTPQNLASSPRGSKKGWPTIAGQVSPEVERMLAHLEVARGIRRTDAVREAVEALLVSYGYQVRAA